MHYPFLTNYIQLANFVVTVITSIITYILVPIFYDRGFFIRLTIFYLIILLIFGAAFFVKTQKGFGNFNESLGHARHLLLGTFSGIVIFGIVAKIWVFFIWDSDLLGLFYCFIIFNVITLLIYIPVHDAIGRFQLPYRNHMWYFYFGILVHFFALVLGIFVGLDYEKNAAIIFFQCYYSFSTLSAIDFFVALVGELGYWVNDSSRTDPEVAENGIEEENRLVRPAVSSECQICCHEYNDDTVIPRILKECGHTVCQECATKLLDNNHEINCPNCRQVTVVMGSVETMPKNFTVLDMARGNGEK